MCKKTFQQQQLWSKRNLMVVALVFFCSLLLAYIYQYNKIVQLRQDQSKLQEKIAITKNFIRLHPNIAKDEKVVSELMIRAENYLPDTPAVDKFITQLTTAAIASETKIAALKIGQVSEVDNMIIVPLQVGLEGTYESLLNFLRRLDKIERFFKIEKWEIHRDTETLVCNIFIKIYADSSLNHNEKQEFAEEMSNSM